ncbi:hypothetical protein DFH08DRAFT_976453 [Mycena albidolilacea]|uniref:Ubiquitin-like domain-containing protein n=1 Tax=Mycena albidolilacea TaxID=1033008 RepID=A0AAD6Z325_9AGAR|nr:hypothetical protein DFH08DRAFT_976453 [Mycena albidolilacea]
MLLIAVALTYGSFEDIKETLSLARRLYATLHGRGEPSGEIKEVLEVLKNFYDDTATLMKPEASGHYVEWGDYNILDPEGLVILSIHFAGTVRAGMQLDMSILKRPHLDVPPDLEACP